MSVSSVLVSHFKNKNKIKSALFSFFFLLFMPNTKKNFSKI